MKFLIYNGNNQTIIETKVNQNIVASYLTKVFNETTKARCEISPK